MPQTGVMAAYALGAPEAAVRFWFQPKPQTSGSATTQDQLFNPSTCFRPCAFDVIYRGSVADFPILGGR